MTSKTTTEQTLAVQHEPLLVQIVWAYRDLVSAFERSVGMSQARMRLLSKLHREPELSQATLQQLLQVDGAAITRQVKQLEEEGLVTRRPDPADNRFTLVSLTAAGRQVADDLVGKREEFNMLIIAGISAEDLAATERCLHSIRENVRAL